MKTFGKIALIGRFKPLHKGQSKLLESCCEKADEVVIGIGSSNKYNARNPFTAQESEEMINAVLSPRFQNYRIAHIPDFAQVPGYANGKKWKEYVTETFGELDALVSGNPYVADLMSDTYTIIHPKNILGIKIPIKGTLVRFELAKGGNWQQYVPEQVTEYLEQNNLVERFQREFGQETISLVNKNLELCVSESQETEIVHTQQT